MELCLFFNDSLKMGLYELTLIGRSFFQCLLPSQ